ncbi:hypothetical protein PGT21_033345 [Puccinia graminis f. sp. tritici]|uniref:Uncharacterized protein n=1 Tax=Puccinia graminis f. sp. tritici TaxID=56615 RepID=A0A5B0Q8V0_PUCGR|nr:hypothetical protein PGT21_033345 [Puccinia graminis f. sp. tritici]KAA1109384.1 hypothetical protein PGTUg99_031498 [Puccinia graminis f. sp. tritici]
MLLTKILVSLQILCYYNASSSIIPKSFKSLVKRSGGNLEGIVHTDFKETKAADDSALSSSSRKIDEINESHNVDGVTGDMVPEQIMGSNDDFNHGKSGISNTDKNLEDLKDRAQQIKRNLNEHGSNSIQKDIGEFNKLTRNLKENESYLEEILEKYYHAPTTQDPKLSKEYYDKQNKSFVQSLTELQKRMCWEFIEEIKDIPENQILKHDYELKNMYHGKWKNFMDNLDEQQKTGFSFVIQADTRTVTIHNLVQNVLKNLITTLHDSPQIEVQDLLETMEYLDFLLKSSKINKNLSWQQELENLQSIQKLIHKSAPQISK